MNKEQKRNNSVYMHKFPNNKLYIGKTSREPTKRWGINGNKYSKTSQPLMYRAIQKYGWENIEHIILFKNLTWEDASKKEMELIKKYKTNCRDYGYNITDGGDGTSGKSHTEEAKKKISDSHKGKYKTDETKMILSELASISVVQIDKNTFEKIKQWDSQKEAGKSLNIPANNISTCCNRIKNRKTAGGYIWMFKEEYDSIPGNILYDTIKNIYQDNRLNTHVKKKILQINKDNLDIINIWDSIASVSKELNYNSGNICMCCKNKLKTYKGFIWKYA